MAYMHRHRRKWGWYFRLNIEGRRRARAPRAHAIPNIGEIPGPLNGLEGMPPANNVRGANGLVVGTYNINGIKNKKTDLEHMLHSEKLDVLGLQETLNSDTDWSIRIPGFNCFEVNGGRRASERGVAVLVRNGYNSYTVGASSPWCVFVRVSGGGLVHPVIVASIYVPHVETNRVKEELTVYISDLADEFPKDPMFLLGDWNMVGNQLDDYIWDWPGLFQRVRIQGNQRTRRALRGRQIDALVGRRIDDRQLVTSGRVQRRWDMSDHYLIIWRVAKANVGDPDGNLLNRQVVPEGDVAGQQPARRIDIRKMLGNEPGEVRNRFVHSNQWEALLIAEVEPAEVDDNLVPEQDRLANQWVDIVHRLVEAENGIAPRNQPTRAWRPNGSIARSIERRCEAHVRATELGLDPLEAARRWEVYVELRRLCRQRISQRKHRDWQAMLQRASLDMADNPRKFWRWASNLAKWKRKTALAGAQPICHPVSGLLLTDSRDIQEGWRIHYGSLAADVTGHSRDVAFWQNRFNHIQRCIPPGELDQAISDADMLRALKRMKNNKAPGMDSIPAEVLKLAIPPGGMEELLQWQLNDSHPPMWRALKRLLDLQWEGALIPEVWQSSVIVSIPKKGDLSRTDNYRGISLMATTLKLLVIIVQQRLNTACEENRLYSPAQAGFRKLEECLIQAGTLLEICQRRKIMILPTYLVFVDIRKAYDTVPHEALFRKMEAYGIEGKALAYIRSLYAKSTIRVRSGMPPNFRMSEFTALLRGLRQGCPLSPTLFNIFINDILVDMEAAGLGVDVPGAMAIICGLMFADDLVLMASSLDDCTRMLDFLTQWLETNEMMVGIHKCGIMAVDEVHGNAQLEARANDWRIGTQVVPIVKEYKYLGVTFTSNIEVGGMMNDRMDMGRKLIFSLSPFLRTQSIPLRMRAAVVKSVVVPMLVYGSEIYGQNKRLVNKMQIFINQSLRVMAGLSHKAPVSNAALWREFSIAPVCAAGSARRTRAWRKCSTSNTWVQRLTNGLLKTRKWTWLKGTPIWLKRYLPRLSEKMTRLVVGRDEVRNGTPWQVLSTSVLTKLVYHAVWEREEKPPGRCKTADAYRAAKYDMQQVFRIGGIHHPSINSGMHAIVKCRIGGFWTSKWRAERKLIARRYLNQCPCCHGQGAEDLYHLMWTCPRWGGIRAQWLQPLREEPTLSRFLQPPDPKGIVTLLLGGEHEGVRIRNWSPPKHNADQARDEYANAGPDNGAAGYSSDESSDGEDDFHFVDGGLDRDRCACFQVAGYLTEVIRARAPIIRNLRNAPGE